ncbi:MAG: penicillin-binding transpeptidase domain-containing protein [Cyclobacteriaceae bacterium]
MNKLITLCTLTSIFFRVYGQQDLVKPFEECGINGSITIYDYNAKKWISSNIKDSHYATLPASTFKIINTLIALDAGIITDENEIIKWPGVTDTVKYGYRPDIYHDMSIKAAFRLSAGWVYVELAKKIGKETYRQYLTDCQYGNVDLSVDDDDFWNFGHFTISPANQIEILKGVYEETLPFSKEHFNILKKMMLNEQTDTYNVYAKTGWTRYQEKDTGWWVGYIERSDNVYFFATRLIQNRKTKNPNFGECRKEITRAVLKQMNIIE